MDGDPFPFRILISLTPGLSPGVFLVLGAIALRM